MPNFTEGEWSVVNGNIYSGDKPIAITTGFNKPDDARLMAQSKKMYSAIKDTLMILRDLAPCAPCNNESCSHLDCSIVRNISAILSDIDKE